MKVFYLSFGFLLAERTKVKFTNNPQTIDPTTESILFDILDKSKKHIPVASISQNKGYIISICLRIFGKCLNVNKKLSQVNTPKIIPSIISFPLYNVYYLVPKYWLLIIIMNIKIYI